MFLTFPEIEAEIFLKLSSLLVCCTFFINLVNLNLNSIFNILNVVIA